MKTNYNVIIDLVVENKNIIKATKYVSPTFIVRATKKLYDKKPLPININNEIILTIGRPNYLEREFIKLCKKAKEPFPIKQIQLKLYNPKKKKSNLKK